MKKICPGCGRNRRLDRKYHNNKTRSDGKQVYCRDCQRDLEKQASRTEHWKILKRKRENRWRRKNKETVKKYNADYYARHKERIMSRRNTESILIIENGSKKSINKSRRKTQKYTDDIVINPQRRDNG